MQHSLNILIVLILGLGIPPACAQPCDRVISGRVMSSTGQPLESAEVILSRDGKKIDRGTATNHTGTFRVDGLCNGRWLVTVRHVGFEAIVISVEMTDDLIQDFTLRPENTQLEDVVIHDHSVDQEGGFTTDAISREDLVASAGKSLGETLREIPGVNTIQAGPGIFKPVIHGLHSQRILILNHGVRQEGQQWGAEHAPEIDPFMAGSIQVIKDASAIRYGVDAIGGVVVVNPPELPEKPGLGGSIQTIGQTNGRGGVVSASLQGGLGRKSGWGWRIQGTARNLGDFRTADYNLSNTGLKERNFSAALGYHHEKGGVEWFISRFQSDVGILLGTAIGNLEDLATAMAAPRPQNTRPFGYDIGEPRQAVEHLLVKMKFHHVLRTGEWRGQYALQQNSRREYDLRRGGLSQLPAIDLALDTHIFDQEWQPQTKGNRKLLIGMNSMLQNNRNIPGTQRIPFIPNFTSTTAGLFVTGEVNRGSVTLEAGTRYDLRWYDVSGRDFRNTLYRENLSYGNFSAIAGLRHQRKAGEVWSTSISSAWRPPHVAELFSLGTHQSAAAIEYGLFLDPETNRVLDRDNVKFRNEKSLKWIAGWSKESQGIRINLTGYSSYIFNYFWLRPGGITQNIRGAFPYFRYTQTEALFAGIDAEINFPVANKTVGETKASWLHATDVRNRDKLIGIPPCRTDASIQRKLRIGADQDGAFVEIRGIYVFRQFRAPMVIAPEEFLKAAQEGGTPIGTTDQTFDFQDAPSGYFLLHMSAGLRLNRDKIRYEARLSGENLLNESYREYTNRFRYFTDDIGRNIKLNLKLIF